MMSHVSATNYFKCAGRFFFFDERFRSSVEKSFLDAQVWQLRCERESRPAVICVWEHLPSSGPWDSCRVVGETPSFADGMLS